MPPCLSLQQKFRTVWQNTGSERGLSSDCWATVLALPSPRGQNTSLLCASVSPCLCWDRIGAHFRGSLSVVHAKHLETVGMQCMFASIIIIITVHQSWVQTLDSTLVSGRNGPEVLPSSQGCLVPFHYLPGAVSCGGKEP